MNQEKIGKFIAELRKAKGLTQAQLADKFGISNKAVSKWENGKSLPDASIMIDLCNLLGISVNELLSGERIGVEDNIIQKSEENIIGIVADSKAKQNRLKKVICLLMVMFVACVGLLFYTNKPYKAISFVADGEHFSAEVSGDVLLLQLDNAKQEKEWYSVMAPEFYTCVSVNVMDDYTEFRIHALSAGKGDMGFLCIGKDGEKEKYVLNVTISSHRKNYLQIDHVSFGKYE